MSISNHTPKPSEFNVAGSPFWGEDDLTLTPGLGTPTPSPVAGNTSDKVTTVFLQASPSSIAGQPMAGQTPYPVFRSVEAADIEVERVNRLAAEKNHKPYRFSNSPMPGFGEGDQKENASKPGENDSSPANASPTEVRLESILEESDEESDEDSDKGYFHYISANFVPANTAPANHGRPAPRRFTFSQKDIQRSKSLYDPDYKSKMTEYEGYRREERAEKYRQTLRMSSHADAPKLLNQSYSN